jgi:putative ABC transport system permease protein
VCGHHQAGGHEGERLLTAALRDLQYRRRRVLVAVGGASLVLALGLVMSGLAASFGNEADRTFNVLGGTSWAVPVESSGPFSAFRPVPEEQAMSGLDGAGGVFIARTNVGTTDEPLDAFVVAVEFGRPGAPVQVDEGRLVESSGEVIMSSRFGFDVGEELRVNGEQFRIVGTVDASLLAGSPLAIIGLDDAQRTLASSLPVVTAVAVGGERSEIPGFRTISVSDARDDAVRPLKDAESTIAFVRTLLWLVAALIVGSVLYLNALERTTDIAVFKAMGVPGRSVIAGMFLQAAIVAVIAAVVAIVIGLLLAPVFPLRVEIPTSAVVTLPIVALVMSFLGALAGVRRATTISPAQAFG